MVTCQTPRIPREMGTWNFCSTFRMANCGSLQISWRFKVNEHQDLRPQRIPIPVLDTRVGHQVQQVDDEFGMPPLPDQAEAPQSGLEEVALSPVFFWVSACGMVGPIHVWWSDDPNGRGWPWTVFDHLGTFVRKPPLKPQRILPNSSRNASFPRLSCPNQAWLGGMLSYTTPKVRKPCEAAIWNHKRGALLFYWSGNVQMQTNWVTQDQLPLGWGVAFAELLALTAWFWWLDSTLVRFLPHNQLHHFRGNFFQAGPPTYSTKGHFSTKHFWSHFLLRHCFVPHSLQIAPKAKQYHASKS